MLPIDSTLALISELPALRLLLAGPCGVGKSSLARQIQKRFPRAVLVEHDALKLEMPFPTECSISRFDPHGCFSARIAGCEEFVIDIGGGCVFRAGFDNDVRLQRMLEFKRDHQVSIVLLEANDDVVRERFLSCKKRSAASFDGTWLDWVDVERGYWLQCADLSIDVSHLVIGD